MATLAERIAAAGIARPANWDELGSSAEGYGLPCIICGDEGHHVPGHKPAEREGDRG